MPVPDCKYYLAAEGSRRCVSYLDNGGCSRQDQFMCPAWLAQQRGHGGGTQEDPPARAGQAAGGSDLSHQPAAGAAERQVEGVSGGSTRPTAHRGAQAAGRFRNKYLSVSRILLYEQCPRAFYNRYVARMYREARKAPQLEFGTLIHKVMELVYRKQVRDELDGVLDLDLALFLYRDMWKRSPLCGAELYEDGLHQVTLAVSEAGSVSHWDVLGIEQKFEIQAGRFTVLGYIDLAERTPDGGVLVTDYKTGMLPMPWDLDASLQLTVYDCAARHLWPWAEHVELQLYQTRQGIKLQTARTEEQRAAALEYLEVMGERTEEDETWEATPGGHCSICDYRYQCSEYKNLLESDTPTATDASDLDAIAREHKALVAKSKAVNTRMRETEKILKAALRDEDEIRAGGSRWSIYPVKVLTHDISKVVELLNNAGLDGNKALTVDKDKMRRLIGKVKDRARQNMLKLEIEAMAKTKIYPRLWERKS